MLRYFCLLVIPVIFAGGMSQQSHACETAKEFFIVEETGNDPVTQFVLVAPCPDKNENHLYEEDTNGAEMVSDQLSPEAAEAQEPPEFYTVPAEESLFHFE